MPFASPLAWITALTIGAQETPVAPVASADPAAPATPVAPRQRSVLFYLIDTCRADHLSVNGYERPTTPYLEELAARGTRFSHCFSQAPWTKPSMSAILTSCYPTVTGMTDLMAQLDNAFVTLPESFRDAGWHTVGFSANPIMGRFSNYNQGFRQFTDATSIIPNGDPIGFASGSARRLNDKVLPWIEANDRWPFFLYVHSVDPHENYEPAQKYLEMFADPAGEKQYRSWWNALSARKGAQAANRCTPTSFELAGVPVDPFIKYGIDLYNADIRANDDEIALLVDKLESNHALDDMIVVVTSDHGEEFMEHGSTSHAFSVWNELLHVPLLIIAPGLVPEGLVIESPVQSIDLYPTLLDLAGIAAPEGLQGRSMRPLLEGQELEARPIFSENHTAAGGEAMPFGRMLSVIEGPWKLILNLESSAGLPRPRRELYRIDRDFGEREELAEANAEIADRLETTVLTWWARNRARREKVDVKSLTLDQLKEADPATLEQLRKLGYVH